MLGTLHTQLKDAQGAIADLQGRLEGFDVRSAAEYDRLLTGIRMVRDDDVRAWERLWQLRDEDEYELAYTEPEPLVSIVIATYTNWRLLRDRALPSVFAQTYENWECVVVGDAAPPEASEVVASFGDARVRFVNLPYRGPYPSDPMDAWRVSGTTPFNTAMKLSRGLWLGAVADDDALVPGCIESLLALARRERAEVAHGRQRVLDPTEPDRIIGTFPPTHGDWGIQGALFHGGLRFLPLTLSDWVFSIPNDWSWAERMLRIGVRFAMLDEVMVDYYPSRRWSDAAPSE